MAATSLMRSETRMAAPADAPAPVFVGGTGRSGTTVVAELIGARADVAYIPVELRLHVDPGGLVDLAEGRVTVDQFARRMRNRWYERPPRNGPRGLHVIATRRRMQGGLRRLRESHEADPWGASRRFLNHVITPFRRETGAATWVEMTPANAKAADALCRMFPRARIVHMVRDGRDVAASVARRTWGPDDVPSALAWWADALIEIHRSIERADPGRVRTFRLESLVGPDREKHYAALVDFLGRDPDPGMRRYFDRELTAERSHPGSWREGLDASEQSRIDELFDGQVERLAQHGVAIPPHV
jgi:hypothetical protein